LQGLIHKKKGEIILEGKGGFFVLVAIVAFLSITLALLAGYVFFAGGPSGTSEGIEHGPESKVIERPDDSELSTDLLFEKEAYCNLKSTDPNVNSVIQISAEIIYFNHIEGIEDPLSKITLYKKQMRELVGTYFQNQTIDEIKLPKAKEKAKKELTEQINDLLNQSEEKRYEFIYTIVFDKWLYQ
jgi:flagellar basal body-associated protein FliL